MGLYRDQPIALGCATRALATPWAAQHPGGPVGGPAGSLPIGRRSTVHGRRLLSGRHAFPPFSASMPRASSPALPPARRRPFLRPGRQGPLPAHAGPLSGRAESYGNSSQDALPAAPLPSHVPTEPREPCTRTRRSCPAERCHGEGAGRGWGVDVAGLACALDRVGEKEKAWCWLPTPPLMGARGAPSCARSLQR